MKKTGIMGGTFNPVHYGHIDIARSAAEECGLDLVLFIPTGSPPHKRNRELAPPVDRFNMAAIAVYGQPGFELSSIETERSAESYSVETLRLLADDGRYGELSFIVGYDTFAKLDTWREAGELHRYCRFIVAPRPGEMPEEVRGAAERTRAALNISARVLSAQGPDISSTGIREMIGSGQDISRLSPASEYICAQGLYGAGDTPVTAQLRKSMSTMRFKHTRSVAATAVRLSAAHGYDPMRAHMAGLMHDCAKGYDAAALMRLIRGGGISVDDIELGMPALLHAPAGVVLARTLYGVTDPEVLSAIRWHTTGRRNMTTLEKIIYLSDLLEPLRPQLEGMEEIRATAYRDLDLAVRMAAKLSSSAVLSKGKKLHPRTLELAKEAT